jgi:DNA-binding NarL/FixJ family response regulator
MRILIVEDDVALASFIRKGLEAEHHTIDTAQDGEEGRSMALGIDYDLVVLDLTSARLGRFICAEKFAPAQGEFARHDSYGAQPGRGSCAMPRLGSRRLSREAIFVS